MDSNTTSRTNLQTSVLLVFRPKWTKSLKHNHISWFWSLMKLARKKFQNSFFFSLALWPFFHVICHSNGWTHSVTGPSHNPWRGQNGCYSIFTKKISASALRRSPLRLVTGSHPDTLRDFKLRKNPLPKRLYYRDKEEWDFFGRVSTAMH